jgi:hypothetical protein
MSVRLSESNIELAERFILENEVKTVNAALSIVDIENGKICYEEIKKMEPTSYMLFGSNAYGMTSYGFYKARNEQIYIIEAFCNNIIGYYDPKTYGFMADKPNIAVE